MGVPTARYQVLAEDKTKKAMKSIQDNTKKTTKGFGNLAKAAAAVGAAFVAFKAAERVVSTFATGAAKELDDLAKAANRLGLTSEQLDRWTFSAELAGASVKDLETIFKRGSRNILDAVAGIGEGARWFKELGIEATTAEGRIKTINQVLFEFADRMDTLGSETAITAASMGLFGRSGQQLVPLLRQGSEGIREMLIEAETLGVRYGDLTRKGEDYIDAQVRINRGLRVIKDTIAAEVLPSLTTLTNTWARMIVDLVSGTTEAQRELAAGFVVDQDLAGLEARFNENEQAISNLTTTINELNNAWDESNWLQRATKDDLQENRKLVKEYEETLESFRKEQELLNSVRGRITTQLAEDEARGWAEIATMAGKAADALEMNNEQLDALRLGMHEFAQFPEDMLVLQELADMDLPPPLNVAVWERSLAEGVELSEWAFGTIADSSANAFSQWIVYGKDARIMLHTIFKQIVADAVAEFAKLQALRLLGGIFGGGIGGLFLSAFGKGASDVAPIGKIGGGNTYILSGLTTTSTAEQVRTTLELDRSAQITAGQQRLER